MANVRENTPPGAWPWGKGKETYQEGEPPEYFDEGKAGLDESTKDAKDTVSQSEGGIQMKDNAEEGASEGQNPLAELKEGLQAGEGDAEDLKPSGEETDLKSLEPEPLTEEEKEKLMPGKDSKPPEELVADAQGVYDDVTEQGDEALDQTQSQIPKEGEEALKEGGSVLDEAQSQIPKEGEEALDETTKPLPSELQREVDEAGSQIPTELQQRVDEYRAQVPVGELDETAKPLPSELQRELDEAGSQVPTVLQQKVDAYRAQVPESVKPLPSELQRELDQAGSQVPTDLQRRIEEYRDQVSRKGQLPSELQRRLDEAGSQVPTDLQRDIEEYRKQQIPLSPELQQKVDEFRAQVPLPSELQRELDDAGSQAPTELQERVAEFRNQAPLPSELQREVDNYRSNPPRWGKLPSEVQRQLDEAGSQVPTDLQRQVEEYRNRIPLPSELQRQVDEAGSQVPTELQRQVDEYRNKVLRDGLTIVPEEPEIVEEPADLSILKGGKVNKGGNVVDENGKVIGRICSGVLAQLVGKYTDENGAIWNDSGKIIGQAELIPEDEREGFDKEPAPFEAFPDAVVDGEGYVVFNDQRVGKVVEGDIQRLRGMKVDQDGDILDRNGNVVGRAERWEPEEVVEEPEEEIDRSILDGKRVNKVGNVVDEDGKVVGRVCSGVLAHLIGRKCDANGAIWNENGKIIGQAELLPEDERERLIKEAAPFEAFPGAVVDSEGYVVFNDERIGKVIEGDIKRLRGMQVDPDGDILDRSGNVVGKAERWEPEPEPEEEAIDLSILAGKRVNKAGNVVDSGGDIYGRVVEGDVKRMVGRMCDKFGNILSESGDIIGRAELVGQGEREGIKEGPFAELSGCTVAKDGTVVTPSGDIVGRLISGDPKVLFGRVVDEDGDVVDRNGNVLGKAERWEPEPEPEKKKNPMSGRRVNREGNVVDEDGNIIGKLTSGDLNICIGKEIDDDGDVVDNKGVTIGHVSLLSDIPEEVEEETEEERQKREQLAEDKKLAQQMIFALTACLDKIKPICQMITSKIEAAERTPKDELDEEQLVREVRPLIEEGGKILTECNGIIRGLDPDGHIQARSKQATATHDGTPEEYHLAELLKELTGTVTQTIENAKKKIEGMPHAKKELNPLWGLLAEPLFQILAGVGMLLAGVLGIVGKLLSGLGLGGLVDGILGGLGIKSILQALGVGSLTDALTGKNQKKKSGGLLGFGG